MKTLFIAILAASLAGLSGCSNIPKEAYIRGAEFTVNTPWGPSVVKAQIMATGKSAIEAAVAAEREGTAMPAQLRP